MNRDVEIIDQELSLIAAVRSSIREQGGQPGDRQVDELLDERAITTASAGSPEAAQAPPADC